MSERQKQHHGRSAGDDSTLEGRDVKADAQPGVGGERVSNDFDEGAEASADAKHIGKLLDNADKDDAASAKERKGGDAGSAS